MTEQANIPKPANSLPWTNRGSFGDADIVSASGDSVYREYRYEGGWFQEPDDFSYTLWAANNAQSLYEALTHPQHGDIAKMLEMAADLIDKGVGPGWETFFTPHLRRAAEDIRAALKAARGETPEAK